MPEVERMLQHLTLNVDTRLKIMLFRIFDRRNEGYFSFKDFEDVMTKRIRPNYKRIVRMERERFKLEGANI